MPSAPAGAVIDPVPCWCGNTELAEWSADYARCARCETLVRRERPAPDIARVVDDNAAFYGREYWFSHQEGELGCPNILHRTRADLPERCLHWLRTALKYKLPPARALELGSGPGGFVAMLAWAGFDASGLELSPWVVQFVRDAFHVPMLLGPVEDQAIEPGSLDLIAAMDVLEHLPDPVGTMRHCLGLLEPEGVFLVQTPCYAEGRTHAAMVAESDRFIEMLQPKDHLYLFSHRSIQQLFERIGVPHVVFEPAIFAEYDMFAVASRVAPTERDTAEVDAALRVTGTGRMIQALIDLDTDRAALRRRHADAEADRAARLEALETLGQCLGQAEAERNDLRAQVTKLQDSMRLSEADRAARLDVIETLGHRLGEVEAERNQLGAELAAVHRALEVAEADRAARLDVIEHQAHRLSEMESQRGELQRIVDEQQATIGRLWQLIEAIQSTRTYRFLRRLDRWKPITQTLASLHGSRAGDPASSGDPVRRVGESASGDHADSEGPPQNR
jgi:2-polyprenyl-3-methyl-5-hydroxy-6-metoxy-1,4-benzoquinol methylase